MFFFVSPRWLASRCSVECAWVWFHCLGFTQSCCSLRHACVEYLAHDVSLCVSFTVRRPEAQGLGLTEESTDIKAEPAVMWITGKSAAQFGAFSHGVMCSYTYTYTYTYFLHLCWTRSIYLPDSVSMAECRLYWGRLSHCPYESIAQRGLEAQDMICAILYTLCSWSRHLSKGLNDVRDNVLSADKTNPDGTNRTPTRELYIIPLIIFNK